MPRMFQLTPEEVKNLRFHFGISSWGREQRGHTDNIYGIEGTIDPTPGAQAGSGVPKT